MDNNIFMEDQKPLSFEQYLQYDEKSRSNLGETLPVLVYRMLEYSMKDELVSRLGKDAQIDIFRKAGQRSGEYFARNMLHLDQPLNQFISELQAKLQELKIGVLRIESVDEETGRITLTVSEMQTAPISRFLVRRYATMMKDSFPVFYPYIPGNHTLPSRSTAGQPVTVSVVFVQRL